MPATINPEPDVAGVGMGHVRCSRPFGSDTTWIFVHSINQDYLGEKHDKVYKKMPHHKDGFVQYLKSDGEI